MQWKCKGAFGERLEPGLQWCLFFHPARTCSIPVMQWMKSATHGFICVICVEVKRFGELLTNKCHTDSFLASECKPCSQPCGPPSAQLNVQPHAPSGTESSSSLSPASIAEDAFFGNNSDDQVKLYILNFTFFTFSSHA